MNVIADLNRWRWTAALIDRRRKTVRWTGQSLCLVLLTTACALGAAHHRPTVADDAVRVSPLNEDEQRAIDSVDVSSVTATISFLASDEMAGRDTPSPELNIAAAYVAARFRGAGLTGPGEQGSFYQTTQLPMVSPATSGARVVVDQMEVPVTAVLMGRNESVSVSGALVDAEAVDADARFSGPVIVNELSIPPQASDSPTAVLSLWQRRVRALASRGASAIIVRLAEDSRLPEYSQSYVRRPVLQLPQSEFACPVLLLSADVVKSGDCTIEVPANRVTSTPVHNVIGILRGSDPERAQEAIVVSAHLDHIGLRAGGADIINNGADDNATGVTGVLTIADAFSKLPKTPARTVIFMTFWGEERGMLGSKYFVQHPLWPLDRIVANVNLEMIGRPEPNAEGRAWGTGWTHSNLGPLMAAGAARVDVTIFHHQQFSEMLYQRSDNISFVQAGVIAHSFSAGSLHADYHQPTDEVDRLNLPHMTRVIQGLTAGILPIAQGEVTPVRTSTAQQN